MNQRLHFAVRRIFASLALCALTATVVACAGDDTDPSSTGSTAPAPAPTTQSASSTSPTTGNSFEVTGTDFYAPPDPLPGEAHGDLIWAEEVESWWGSPRRAWRVLYRSESLGGDPIAVSGFMIAPPADTGGSAALPVVAWAHGTVGMADKCAPSRSFEGAATESPTNAAAAAQLMALVDSGAVVVASDYEGLGTPGPHPFLVGESAGRSVLDAVLAASQVPGANAGPETLVFGLSQGGQAALWAGQIAPDWTPSLDVVGVVAAAPFSEVDLLLPAAGTIPGAEGYVVMGVYGQAAANPDLDPVKVLDPSVVERSSLIDQQCAGDVISAFRQHSLDIGRPVASIAALLAPEWQEQLASIKPGMAPIAAPVLIAQGERDTTIPAATTRVLVDRMCQSGDNVTTVSKPEAGHGDIVAAADAEIREWVNARLAGESATSSCPS